MKAKPVRVKKGNPLSKNKGKSSTAAKQKISNAKTNPKNNPIIIESN